MLPLGTYAPAFELPDAVSGKKRSLANITSGKKATVVMFICNHCPYVVHIIQKLVEVAKQYQEQNIGFVAISSNNIIKYPEDAPDKMADFAQQYGFSFPYLYDETQQIAKAYQAACTPDFYVFNSDLHCIYRGRFDAATPGNGVPVTGKDLSQALEAILANNPIVTTQLPSMGCNIKWKD